jgi:O-acetyl-ADP-ribose deacetylase (regulator of RNase III)
MDFSVTQIRKVEKNMESSVRVYKIGKSTLTLIFGDITKSQAEVLVSSDDYLVSMGGGVSRAIYVAGGNQIGMQASKMTPAKIGDVVVTSAGNLPAKYVFHAITIGKRQDKMPGDAIVRQTVQKAMRLLPLLGCRSIAFPAIGAGIAGIPYKVVASQLATVLVEVLFDTPEEYKVELYLWDRSETPEKVFSFFEEFIQRMLGVATLKKSASASTLEMPKEKETENENENEKETSQYLNEVQRRHNIFTMLRHLDARRNQLEAKLVYALAEEKSSSETELSEVRSQLAEIQKLRLLYEADLVPTAKSDAVIPKSVFVSSTASDLQPYRKAVREVVENLQFKFVGMEEFAPTATAPGELIRHKVNESQNYVGILGMRYGSIETTSGFSMTELEYRQAIASNKPIFIFVMDRNAPITADMVEDNPTGYGKLLDFKTRVLKAHTCAMFTTPEDLAQKVGKTLQEGRK